MRNDLVDYVHPDGTLHGAPYNPRDYANSFDREKAAIEHEAANSVSGFNAKMAELINLQHAEILKLQGILKDNTTIPERVPVKIAVGLAAASEGRVTYPQRAFFVLANDGSLWSRRDSPPGAPWKDGWQRVENLPQAGDELERAQR